MKYIERKQYLDELIELNDTPVKRRVYAAFPAFSKGGIFIL